MMRPLALCTVLVGLAACTGQLPPPPATVPPVAAIHDSLIPPLDLAALSADTSIADAVVLNDLAAAAPDERVVPAFDASEVRWDIDVRTFANHPRVRYYLDYFQGIARSRMEVFLARGARFEAMIRTRFQAEGLPGDLGYLALIESGYSSNAVSHSYAVGMWQFMKGTGRGYGLRVDSWVDERRDPVKATDAAARHLRDLRERFGSLYLAAAAYNAGAGKVSRSLGKLQWDTPTDTTADSLDATADSLDAAADSAEEDTSAAYLASDDTADADTLEAGPDSTDVTSDAAFFRLASTDLLAAETQDYVPKLIAAALIAKAPGRYGFAVPTAEPFAYDSLVVTDATGLDVVARLAGTSLADMQALNPQYLRLVTPPRSTMVIRVPAGTGPTVAEGYATLKRSDRVHYLTYVPRRRERLSSIAARYHLPARELQIANPRLGSRVASHTRVVIPAAGVPTALAMRATGTLGSIRGHHRGRIHRVRPGETLSSISRRYHVSVRSLVRANALPSAHMVRAGTRLRIPS